MIEFKTKNIAVVGDCIIDEYFDVNAEKVSPEFPIPILQFENSSPNYTLPGGAANVCYQFLHLNQNVNCFGILDFDAYEILQNFINIDNCVLFANAYSKIPRKKRFYQDVFPICRLDVESNNYNLSVADLNKLQEKLSCNLKGNFDICIFSDYNKGVFNNFDISKYISAVDCVKVVDPKKGPANKWFGCDIIKPNYKEALEMSGKADWKEQALFFRKETNAKAVVITKAADGVFSLINDEFIEFIPSSKSFVNSVIGAGDCFVAYFSSAIANNLSISNSIELAYKAASKYVQNKHNRPVHILEMIEQKHVKPELLKSRNFTLCFTNGCFDILHPGHIHSLEYAKSKADKLVVAINSDQSVAKLNKSHGLVNCFEIRKKMIESLECVDYIVEFDESTPLEVIRKINPDVLVKSEEYQSPAGSDLVKNVYRCPVLPDFSTTKIIEKIKNL